MTDTDPERMALATAIFAARAAAFENEVEGDLYRMAGNYREAYAGVTAFRDELAFWGYTVTPLAATPAPLDDLRARTALALALEETEGEWRGTGSASWMAKVVWPVMEAHLAATPAPLDEQPLFDRIRELNAEVALLKKEAREDRAEIKRLATPAPLDVIAALPPGDPALLSGYKPAKRAATPAPLDVIAAVRKVFDSGARLKHKADDPTSSYDPLARETVVLAALRAALDGGPS